MNSEELSQLAGALLEKNDVLYRRLATHGQRPAILKNAIRCKKCGLEVESTRVHHYIQCACGACAADGGHEYLRRAGDPNDYEDVSIFDLPLLEE